MTQYTVQYNSKHKIFRYSVGTLPPWPIFCPRGHDSQVSWGFISFISSCNKESYSGRKDYFQPMEKISCNNKLSPASRNYFLIQNIISWPKKLYLVTRKYCCQAQLQLQLDLSLVLISFFLQPTHPPTHPSK